MSSALDGAAFAFTGDRVGGDLHAAEEGVHQQEHRDEEPSAEEKRPAAAG